MLTQQALLVPVLQVLEPLASALNCGSPHALAQAGGELDLDLLGLLVGIRSAEHRLEQLGVQDQRVEVVADGVDVDVLVDQLDRLRRRARARAACPCRSTASATRRPARASGSRSRTGVRTGSGETASQMRARTLKSAAKASRMSLFGRHSCAAISPS